MAAFVDLHCHWVAGIDDGARTQEEGLAILAGLGELGFEHVVATLIMRPGMFDNDWTRLEEAYQRMLPALDRAPALPRVLAGERAFLRRHGRRPHPRRRSAPLPGGTRRAGLAHLRADSRRVQRFGSEGPDLEAAVPPTSRRLYAGDRPSGALPRYLDGSGSGGRVGLRPVSRRFSISVPWWESTAQSPRRQH